MPQQDENEKKRKNSKTKTGAIVAVVLVVIVIGMVLAAFVLGSANLRQYDCGRVMPVFMIIDSSILLILKTGFQK
jgi:hypothetical protein